MNHVLRFIETFNQYPQVITCFTSGNCYWFAHILKGRFNGHIVYDEIANHFGYAIGDEVYDITGIVTNKYNWELWSEVRKRDALHAARIERDCILKEF